jgi:hypothetical protein
MFSLDFLPVFDVASGALIKPRPHRRILALFFPRGIDLFSQFGICFALAVASLVPVFAMITTSNHDIAFLMSIVMPSRLHTFSRTFFGQSQGLV